MRCHPTLGKCCPSHSLPSGASDKQVIAFKELTLISVDLSSLSRLTNGSKAPAFIAVYLPFVVMVILQ